jgi:GWxTD domain-containing protein
MARRSFQRAIDRNPDDPTIRVLCARLLLPSVVRYNDDAIAQEALGILRGAQGEAASNRDILYLESLFLCISHNLVSSGRLEKSMAARACTETILARNASDVPACLLNGVQCLDLGDVVEADYCFRLGILNATDETKVAYYLPTYSAPESVMTRIGALPEAARVRAIAAYWDGLDPTPLSPINEVLLEYWKRLTLADVLYGDLVAGTRGWQTPRGEILVRYGVPHVATTDLAQWTLGNASVPIDVKLEMRKMKMPVTMAMDLSYPTQTWHYALGGADLRFDFVDADLHDHFTPAEPDAYRATIETIPFVPMDAYAGGVKRCFIATAGVRDGDHAGTRQLIDFAIPPWSSDPVWWRDATYTVSIVDARARRFTVRSDSLGPAAVQPSAAGTSLAVLTTTSRLDPGRYSLEIAFDSKKAKGSFTTPMDVRAFQRDSLQLSDVRLSMGGIAPASADPARGGVLTPNPTGAIVVGDPADVSFEIYNLESGAADIARYQTRYVLLPREYVVEFARRAAAGTDGVQAEARFGAYGRSLGGVTLTRDNYADVLFPVSEVRIAPSGRGVGSIRVETAGLDPGLYALVVIVTDLSTRRMAWAQIPLRIMRPDDLRRYLTGS